MLQSHLNAIEAVLLAQSIYASNAGHPNLRGGPKEWFIRDFLSSHLPGVLQIGQGEIIDSDSKPKPDPEQYRPQVDIILYRRDLPVISLSKTDKIFLSEGVMATIEVKSSLKKAGKGSLKEACKATFIHKNLKHRLFPIREGSGWFPEQIVSYVIGFDGPKRMCTVAGWLPQICETLKCTPDNMPEMIVVLGKGVVWRINAFPVLKFDQEIDNKTWAYVQQQDKNLCTLFLHMLSWMGWITAPPQIHEYLASLSLSGVDFI